MEFPACVPTLIDTAAGVTLRAPCPDDLPGIVEQSNDPDTVRWTAVPTPDGGYSLDDARFFLDEVIRPGWEANTSHSWTIVAQRDGAARFCGAIDLRLDGQRGGSVGFALHPGARGRGIMTSALCLVRDHGFDQLGLEVIGWEAHVGNWGSRRVAAAAGFRFEGTRRKTLAERGRRLDGWGASITASDPRTSLLWPAQPVLSTGDLVLRPLDDADASRIVEACSDPETRRWIPRLPDPYGPEQAAEFIHLTRELAAIEAEHTWAVADVDGVLLACITAIHKPRLQQVEIGYWAHPDARGRGVLTAAVARLTAEVRQTRPVVTIECDAANTASAAVARRAGFREVGALGTHTLFVHA